MTAPADTGRPAATSFSALRFLALGVATTFLVPPVVFTLCALAEGMGLGGSFGALVAQYQADRLNLFMLAILGVIPFASLTIALVAFARFGAPEPVPAMAVGGWAAISLLLVWAHASYWPSFLPEGVAPMWPHGIEFVIVPLFFAPVGAIVGMVAGGLVHRYGVTR